VYCSGRWLAGEWVDGWDAENEKMDNLYKLDKLSILYYSLSMNTVSATQAKQNFAALIDAAQRGPVHIRRHDREVAVLVSSEEFERLRKDRWAEFNRLGAVAAEQAKASGLTEETLSEILAD
jgi:prevent-host-death family protein